MSYIDRKRIRSNAALNEFPLIFINLETMNSFEILSLGSIDRGSALLAITPYTVQDDRKK